MRNRPQKPWSPPERRSPRAVVPTGVRVFLNRVDSHATLNGWAKNLSYGGIFIESPEKFGKDTEVLIHALARTGDTVHKIQTGGWVVHTQKTGLGIQFDEMDRATLLTVKKLVDYYLEQGA